jgi:restriction system protein
MTRKEREGQRTPAQPEEELPEEAEAWRSKLHHVLTKELSPDAFERLVKRMLRESGFIQVEVTGRTGDGGIDGKGIVKVGGLLSFHVLFQCRKYQGSVSPGAIRDFRGALVGRADKGLFVTTGTFTRDAIREATRDGAPPIDLIDGDQLAEKLKELHLGIKTEMVESVDVDMEWFQNI